MQFSVEAKDLAAALAKIKGTIQTRTTMPVLSCARVEASGSEIIVTGSDSTNECSVKIPADVQAGGVCAIPAGVITNIAKIGRSGTLSVDVTKGIAAIKCGRSRYSVATVSADEYPLMKQEQGARATVATKDLMRMFAVTKHAQSTDSSRYYLMGTHVHIKGRTLVAAATDGHRCVSIAIPTPRGLEPIRPITIGAATIDLLRGIAEEAEEISVCVGPSTVSFLCGKVALTGRLVDGTFPNYERAIPEDCDRIIAATEAERIMEGIDALLAIDDGGKSFAVRIGPMNSDGLIGMTARQSREGRQANSDIEGVGSDASAGVNAAYLKAALSIYPEGVDVVIQQENASAPIKIVCEKTPEISCVVMPMRANVEAIKDAAE